jgi:signal transduction histidine kinase
VDAQVPFETELIERIDWLIRLRWLAVAGLGLALVAAWLWYPGQFALLPLVGLTLIIALYNLQFLLYARTLRLGQAGALRLQHATRFAYVQIVLDLVALAILVHLSGGVESPASLFFVFHTIIASILLSRRVSFFMATLAALLFAATVGLEYAAVLPHYHLPLLGSVEVYRQGPHLIGAAGTLAVTLWLVAYMTSSIGARLRERDLELMDSYVTSLSTSRELEMANERLRRVDAERTRFMTFVTHEMRAPLNTIHTCVELALDDRVSPERVRDILERVKTRTLELTDLISDLLRLARAREDAMRKERLELVQAAEVLNNVVTLMQAEAHSRDLFLSVDVEPDLPPVRANADSMKLVWTNLLSNAIKYTEAGGISVVTLRKSADQLVASVRDTGIGISPEDLQRIFEEFYRADNAKDASPAGTGVGLAIVRRIIQNWGGEVWVESELGLGSKFTFVVPYASET